VVEVELIDITKMYGKVIAAYQVNLKIGKGELFTLLGPSGCGKTTILRIIAGFEIPDKGRIIIGGKDVTDLPPYVRGTSMVFQNYALWPHMTVFDNIAYGLKVKKLPKNEIKLKVKEILELVKLEGLENRYPHQLSGGQQQRVALARALVVEPHVLLLDEPLSNLDAKLRIEMREELKKLQKSLGITTIYVTHDQEEAMVLSDRLAVMNQGRILQVGAPREIYERPINFFVATFIGRSSIIEGKIERVKSNRLVEVRCEESIIRGVLTSREVPKIGDRVYCVLRPEEIRVEKKGDDVNEFEGTVEWLAYVGNRIEARVKVGKEEILVSLDPNTEISLGQRLRFYIPVTDTIVVLS